MTALLLLSIPRAFAQMHLIGPMPLVDPGVRPIAAEASGPFTWFDAPAFRTARDGWLPAGGDVFRTHDGGLSWRRASELESVLEPRGWFDQALAQILWISERIGIAARPTTDSIARTVDGGATWRRVPLPGVLEREGVAQRGPRIWLVGYFRGQPGQRLFHSGDAGATWKLMGPEDCCRWVSFADADHGWGLTSDRILETSDGGQHWRPIAEQAARVRRIERLTRERGIVWGERTWLTTDAGRTWAERMGPIDLRPSLFRWGNHGIVQPRQGDWSRVLEYSLDGRVVRAETPLTAGTGVREPLIGIGSFRGRAKWGWSATRIYQSHDGGATWFHADDAPEELRRVRYVKPGCGVAETRSGLLLHTRRWVSTSAKTFESFSEERCYTNFHAALLDP